MGMGKAVEWDGASNDILVLYTTLQQTYVIAKQKTKECLMDAQKIQKT